LVGPQYFGYKAEYRPFKAPARRPAAR
jgi:hypothetical protein